MNWRYHPPLKINLRCTPLASNDLLPLVYPTAVPWLHRDKNTHQVKTWEAIALLTFLSAEVKVHPEGLGLFEEESCCGFAEVNELRPRWSPRSNGYERGLGEPRNRWGHTVGHTYIQCDSHAVLFLIPPLSMLPLTCFFWSAPLHSPQESVPVAVGPAEHSNARRGS